MIFGRKAFDCGKLGEPRKPEHGALKTNSPHE
jgi:hypothetical protein